MHACLAVTCHLHFWQNDRDFLRATVVTRGWNGYRNKSQHRKLTLEKKILPVSTEGNLKVKSCKEMPHLCAKCLERPLYAEGLCSPPPPHAPHCPFKQLRATLCHLWVTIACSSCGEVSWWAISMVLFVCAGTWKISWHGRTRQQSRSMWWPTMNRSVFFL